MIWIIIDTALIILALGTGAGSILMAMRINGKYDYNYLNSFMYYQILLFIFGLYGLLGTIFVRSILIGFDIPPSTIKSLAEFIPYLGVPVIITAWFMFLKMSFEVVGKVVTSIGSILYFGIVLLAMLGYIIIIFIYRNEGNTVAESLASFSKYGFLGINFVTMMIAFFVLFRYGLIMKHRHKRKMVLYFAIIALVVNVVTLTVFVLSEPNTFLEKAYMVLFFAGQLPTVLFLAYFLNRYFSPIDSRQGEHELFNKFIADYQLSKRESEIVEQLCKGLTNGQISDTLFISLQTVKDHVYHIYKKTGVKNRVQLVNMVSAFERSGN